MLISNSISHIADLIKAKTPLIWVLTYEERRFSKELFNYILEHENGKEIWTWSCVQGLVPLAAAEEGLRAGEAPHTNKETVKAPIALEEIKSMVTKPQGHVFILKDFHTVLSQPIPRQIRDMYRHLIKDRKTIIITSPRLAHGPSGQREGMEPTLEKEIVVIDYELPDYQMTFDEVNDWVSKLQKKTPVALQNKLINTEQSDIEKYTRALQGLTLLEIEGALAASVAKFKNINVDYLLKQKKQIVKRSDILEYIDTSESFGSVGGCDEVKKFFELYSDQFSVEAKNYGIDPLRGVILTGIAGCGKSLIAKAISSVWKMPLLRLDIGKVMAGIVGSSEARMREAVSMAEAVSPCLLWVDEIDKGLSGIKSSNSSDGGTIARVFGTLLTSMEERMENVVVIATSNDIQALPTELIRRFDEVFFMDLPETTEREEIFAIHIKKRKRDPEKLDLHLLSKNAENFTGSEIEKVVKNGLVRAWYDGKREVIENDFIEAIKETKPLAEIMKEQIDGIRKWAAGRARYASSKAKNCDKAKAKAALSETGSDEGDRLLDVMNSPSKINKEGSSPSIDDLLD